MSEDVYIYGVGMIKFGKYPDKTIKELTGQGLKALFEDCDLTPADIEAAWFSNAYWGMHSGQHSIRGQIALSVHGIEGIPITNVENACAGGSTALHSAWTAVKAGLYDCTLAIGVEKGYDPNPKTRFKNLGGTDAEEMGKLLEYFLNAQKTVVEENNQPAGGEKIKKRSIFMDFYAAGAKWHMNKYGTTQHQLAIIASKAHNNAVLNPLAQYTFPMTVDEVLQDREVAYPLTRAMCAPAGDGAAAAIVCSEKFLKKHSRQRAVQIRASVLNSGKRNAGDNDLCTLTSDLTYDKAGVGPEDISLAEVHDATAFGELYLTEGLRFCPPGEGGPYAELGATALTGIKPINTSGGLISRGHPIGASGLAQIFELVTQLRGEAGQRQVNRPRLALAENGGGTFTGGGEAAMAIHILEKPH